MKTNGLFLLLRTQLASTSGRTILKYSQDKKRKNRVIGGYVGFFFLGLLIVAYGILTALGYGMVGKGTAIPGLTALSVSAIAFIFTFLRANAYLYGFKEYDMLMAMPFEVKDIVGSKFLYMYVKNLPWYYTLSLSCLVGYAICEKPGFITYLVWLLLSLVLPVIPSVLAAAIGSFAVAIGVKFKHKKLFQVIFTFLFILFSFSLRFIIEAVMKNGEGKAFLTNFAQGSEGASSYYFPAKWFALSVSGEDLGLGILLILLSLGLSFGFFLLISKSYRRLNSKLMVSDTQTGKSKITYKQSSVVNAIAQKELRRLLGSTTYLVNNSFGHVMAILLGLIGLFLDADQMISVVTQGAPLSAQMLVASIPLLGFFFVGMVPTTCCSLSLEGKNYWIVQSLPISRMDLYRGKIRMNLWISVPSMLLCSLGLCICFRAGIVNTLLICILSIILCLYSSLFGMICGIKFRKFEWENEIEVVKQGAAVAVYLFPNMILTMGLCVLAVVLELSFGALAVLLGLMVIYSLLSLLCYAILRRM